MLSLLTLAALLTGAALAGVLYLGGLPEAPLCPACRGMTGETEAHWPGAQTLSHVSTTVVRQCGGCGWRGRMRWRPSVRRVRWRG